MDDFYENFNTFIADAVYEIFLEEFNRSKLIKSHYNFLQNFQLILEQIPLWNSPTCEKKWEFIVRHSNCDWLDDYYKSIMYAKVKNIVETYGLDSEELDIIKEYKCPPKEVFLRDLLTLCARNFYKNPYLFNSSTQLEKVDNATKIKKSIHDSIKIIIHKYLPTREILKKCSPENILLNSINIHKKKNVSDLSIQCELEVNSHTFKNDTNKIAESVTSNNNSDYSKINISEKEITPIIEIPSVFSIDGGTIYTDESKTLQKQQEEPVEDMIRISVPANIMRNIDLPQGAQLSQKEENNNEKYNENYETKTTDKTTVSTIPSSENVEESYSESLSFKNNNNSTEESEKYLQKKMNIDSESSIKESSISDEISEEYENLSTIEKSDTFSMNDRKQKINNNNKYDYKNLTKAFEETNTNKKNKKKLFKSLVK